MALVPTTLSGNKWLFNISMHTKRQRKKRTVMNKTKRSNKKGPRLQHHQHRASERERGNMRRVK